MAKLDPKNIIEICLLDKLGIFDDNQLIPEGNKKQMQIPINPVAKVKEQKNISILEWIFHTYFKKKKFLLFTYKEGISIISSEADQYGSWK